MAPPIYNHKEYRSAICERSVLPTPSTTSAPPLPTRPPQGRVVTVKAPVRLVCFDVRTMLQILGQIDRGHPAATQFPLDGVAVGEGRREALQRVRHESEFPIDVSAKLSVGSECGQGGLVLQAICKPTRRDRTLLEGTRRDEDH